MTFGDSEEPPDECNPEVDYRTREVYGIDESARQPEQKLAIIARIVVFLLEPYLNLKGHLIEPIRY